MLVAGDHSVHTGVQLSPDPEELDELDELEPLEPPESPDEPMLSLTEDEDL